MKQINLNKKILILILKFYLLHINILFLSVYEIPTTGIELKIKEAIGLDYTETNYQIAVINR